MFLPSAGGAVMSPLSSPLDLELARALFVSPLDTGVFSSPAARMRAVAATAGAAGGSASPAPANAWGEVEAAATAAVGAPWQRNNSRISEMFRKNPGAAPAAGRPPLPPQRTFAPALPPVRAEEVVGALNVLQDLGRSEGAVEPLFSSPSKRARGAAAPPLRSPEANPFSAAADALIALTPGGGRIQV